MEKASAVDPVCHMSVEIATARLTSEHGGTTYYFCSAGCKAAFDRDPGSYVRGASGHGEAPAR